MWGVPGVFGTLVEVNSHFDPNRRSGVLHHHVKEAVGLCRPHPVEGRRGKMCTGPEEQMVYGCGEVEKDMS